MKEKKEKKELTIKQEKNRAKLYSRLLFAGEYASAFLPYGIMAIVNREEWFVLNPEPWKVGLGGALGLILVSLAMFLITKKKEDEKITNGMVSLIIIWYAITFVFFLLAHINMEIYKIMAYGGMGLIGSLGLEVGSKHFERKANDLDKAIKEAELKLNTEKATKEMSKSKQKEEKVAVD